MSTPSAITQLSDVACNNLHMYRAEAAQGIPMLTAHEALSGIFGSIALASWTTVFVPQLVENYRQQSAEAVSLVFVAVWITGDVFSLVGAVWAGLLPIIIANGIAFCTTDCIFLVQCLYYRFKCRARLRMKSAEHHGPSDSESQNIDIACECTPFLRQLETTPMSGQTPPSCMHGLASTTKHDTGIRAISGPRETSKTLLTYEVPIFVTTVVLVGSVGWLFAYRVGLWQPSTRNSHEKVDEKYISAQILGSCSAIANLCARVPQIVRNTREKNCTGTKDNLRDEAI